MVLPIFILEYNTFCMHLFGVKRKNNFLKKHSECVFRLQIFLILSIFNRFQMFVKVFASYRFCSQKVMVQKLSTETYEIWRSVFGVFNEE